MHHDAPKKPELGSIVNKNIESETWLNAIHHVIECVVTIRFCHTISFDTDQASTGEATGFVVDAENGYILTNRHVVGAGPFWGHALFDKHQEVDVYAVYRDPVHDFGILRFDPEAVKCTELNALVLRPDLARVGVEIRVVGNDAGEKLSILSSFISRLDRNAPDYEEGYTDFNTCYYQASAATSGGSSGSPIVNIDGFVLGLHAGGRCDGASTGYFLPLDRPLRALELIRQNKPVTRGDIQCQFLLKSFNECRRLGLTPKEETAARKAFPEDSNMLVAEIILPRGQSDNKIEEGDILVKVNGERVLQFIRLDDLLDSNVGKTIRLQLQRGGEDIEVEVDVGDLHRITPDRLVFVAGNIFHDLSYQQARFHRVVCRGVFVCNATSGSFNFDKFNDEWLIESVNHRETTDLDTFIEVMKTIPDTSRVVVSYRHLYELHTPKTAIIVVRHWSAKMRMAVRNDDTGLWDFSDLADPLPPTPPARRSASFIELENVNNQAIADLVRSFVRVNCTIPFKLDGFLKNSTWGVGLVVDADKGLVIISRAIVPHGLCDVAITIAESIIVDGKVIFLHPQQNYTIIQYDPKLVDAPVKSAKLSTEVITQGASTYFMGCKTNGTIVHATTTVTEISAIEISANHGLPKYHAINVDFIHVDTDIRKECGSGVLVADDGTVQALWLTYLGKWSSRTRTGQDAEDYFGFATPSLLPVISQVQQGIIPKLRMLPVEFEAITIAQARDREVSDEWLCKVPKANKTRHQLFMVSKRTFEHDQNSESLQQGDILISINDKVITRVSELDIMYFYETLDLVIVRAREEIRITAHTIAADDIETDRALFFCGATLHRPHHAVRQRIGKLHGEVYVSAYKRGSPSYQYKLAPTNFITHVNGKPTPDLETFLAMVLAIPDNTYFHLKTIDFRNVSSIVHMKKNEHYFPTVE